MDAARCCHTLAGILPIKERRIPAFPAPAATANANNPRHLYLDTGPHTEKSVSAPHQTPTSTSKKASISGLHFAASGGKECVVETNAGRQHFCRLR
jgi:hypothetical protein